MVLAGGLLVVPVALVFRSWCFGGLGGGLGGVSDVLGVLGGPILVSR